MTARLLVLVRHAKSLQDGRADHGRALNDRGRREAPLVGQWLARQDLPLDRVVVSSALRTQQTWQLAAAAIRDGGVTVPEPVIDDRLYDNTVDDLAAVVISTPAVVRTLVLVGHNPSLQSVVLSVPIAGDGPANAPGLTAVQRDFPPASVAILSAGNDLDGSSWADVRGGDLTLESVWTVQTSRR